MSQCPSVSQNIAYDICGEEISATVDTVAFSLVRTVASEEIRYLALHVCSALTEERFSHLV
jgi:hypothetical protein